MKDRIGFLVDVRELRVTRVAVHGETARTWHVTVKDRVLGHDFPGSNVRKFVATGSVDPLHVMFDTAQGALDYVAVNVETRKRKTVAEFDRKLAAVDAARAQWYLGDSPTGKKE